MVLRSDARTLQVIQQLEQAVRQNNHKFVVKFEGGLAESLKSAWLQPQSGTLRATLAGNDSCFVRLVQVEEEEEGGRDWVRLLVSCFWFLVQYQSWWCLRKASSGSVWLR